MAKKDSLTQYRKKRDFSATPEPEGKVKKTQSKKTFYMIHKHSASRLHYDLRIEVNGVLKSWAIPKGPSTDPSVKRLAILVEDHPRQYANFEGVIPEGNYGAGPVMIWDEGTCQSLREKAGRKTSIKASLKEGIVELFFEGKKLHGAYALVRISASKNWLFIKIHDDYANKPIERAIRDKSVKSGRTLTQIQKEG